MKVPYGYGTEERTIDWVETWLLANYHPEYVARLVAWTKSRGGNIGIGGGFRPDGTQPNKPGFAPAGKSFHQNQKYNDGFVGATAVDLVHRNPGSKHRSPYWTEVPAQGTSEAELWGVHCNVGTPGAPGSEPWHMQPTEIDGHATWLQAGSPAPVANYPFPNRSKEGNKMAALSNPIEWFDTRNGAFGPLQGGATNDNVLPVGPELDGAVDVYINVTVIRPVGEGFVTVWSDGPQPKTSNVNFGAGQVVANTALVKVGPGRRVKFFCSASTHLKVDIQGASK